MITKVRKMFSFFLSANFHPPTHLFDLWKHRKSCGILLVWGIRIKMIHPFCVYLMKWEHEFDPKMGGISHMISVGKILFTHDAITWGELKAHVILLENRTKDGRHSLWLSIENIKRCVESFNGLKAHWEKIQQTWSINCYSIFQPFED